MCGNESGGSHTAKLLKEAVTRYIADACQGKHISRIDARVYANLKSLSLEAVDEYSARQPYYKKPNIPRALGAFAAGFSREEVFFDFVDVAAEQAVEKRITGKLFRETICGLH